MEKTERKVVVIEEEDARFVYMPPGYAEQFLAEPPELPFQVDREHFQESAEGWLLPQLRRVRQMVPPGGCLGVKFDKQGRMGGNWITSSRRVEVGKAVVDEGFQRITREHFDRMERAIWRLRGLLDLLAACDINRASEVQWEDAADGLRVFADEIYEVWEGLRDEWHKAYAKGLNAEASPTAAKQGGEAPKGQDS